MINNNEIYNIIKYHKDSIKLFVEEIVYDEELTKRKGYGWIEIRNNKIFKTSFFIQKSKL